MKLKKNLSKFLLKRSIILITVILLFFNCDFFNPAADNDDDSEPAESLPNSITYTGENSGSYKISGTAVDKNGNPLSGIKIECHLFEDGGSYASIVGPLYVETKDDGKYNFDGLPNPDQYETLHISMNTFTLYSTDTLDPLKYERSNCFVSAAFGWTFPPAEIKKDILLLEVNKSTILKGTIKYADGNPVPAGELSLLDVSYGQFDEYQSYALNLGESDPADEATGSFYNETTGEFQLKNCLQGGDHNYALHINHSDSETYSSWDSPITIHEGVENEVQVVIMKNETNSKPEADAGEDQNVSVGDTVVLDGSSSSDADGDSLTYSWTMLSAPDASTAVLSDSGIVNPSIVPNAPGEYLVQLIVHDGTEESDVSEVKITSTNIGRVNFGCTDNYIVRGTLTDEKGDSAAGVEVSIGFSYENGGSSLKVISNTDGEYSINGLPSPDNPDYKNANYQFDMYTPDDYEPYYDVSFSFDGSTNEITQDIQLFKIVSGTGIKGYILDPDGVPIEYSSDSAADLIQIGHGSRSFWSHALGDDTTSRAYYNPETGFYSFNNMMAGGTYILNICPPGYVGISNESIVIAPGETVTRNFTLSKN